MALHLCRQVPQLRRSSTINKSLGCKKSGPLKIPAEKRVFFWRSHAGQVCYSWHCVASRRWVRDQPSAMLVPQRSQTSPN